MADGVAKGQVGTGQVGTGEVGTGEPPSWLSIARRAKGFMPDDEGLALHRAGLEASKSASGPFLEVGTYCGKSAVYLGAAARQTGRVLFSVDHHHGSEELQPGWSHHDPAVVDRLTGQIDTLPWARRNIREAGLERDVVLVVGESVTVARAWAEPLSLLFIDGGHGEEVAWADYRSWAPKVADGGTLAIHDVFADPRDGGQVPYDLYCAAVASGEFRQVGAVGSLRLLARVHPSDGRTTGARECPG
jgi:MMP 1-O-methyltransferase